MDRFSHITIGELLEIKKISKMSIKNALPKVRELKAKYNFTDIETKNLLRLARNFDTRLMLKEIAN